jgi:sterol desaturase/sphingolipid hydroxylase (fatty acid hydroxylase superfamily)
MDVLFGYFGLPTLFGSTYFASSLNVLFFYLTWSMLIMSHSPLEIEVVGSIAVRLIFYWIPALMFTLFELGMPGMSRDLKTRRGKKVAGDVMFSVGLYSLLNQGIATAIQGLVHAAFAYLLTPKYSLFNIGTTLPMPWNIIKDTLVILILREILTYPIHRYVLHNRRNFPRCARLHQVHHQYAESPCFALKAHYAHPLDYLLLQFLPLYLPAYLYRLHLLTFFVILAIVSLESALIYSGYDIFWGLLGGTVRRVNRHHSPGGDDKDFGIWGIIDWTVGTAGGRSRPEEEGGAIDLDEEIFKELRKRKMKVKARFKK